MKSLTTIPQSIALTIIPRGHPPRLGGQGDTLEIMQEIEVWPYEQVVYSLYICKHI